MNYALSVKCDYALSVNCDKCGDEGERNDQESVSLIDFVCNFFNLYIV